MFNTVSRPYKTILNRAINKELLYVSISSLYHTHTHARFNKIYEQSVSGCSSIFSLLCWTWKSICNRAPRRRCDCGVAYNDTQNPKRELHHHIRQEKERRESKKYIFLYSRILSLAFSRLRDKMNVPFIAFAARLRIIYKHHRHVL